jgi:hypothetical protein
LVKFPLERLQPVDWIPKPASFASFRQARLLDSSFVSLFYGKGKVLEAFPWAETDEDGSVRTIRWFHRLHDVRDLGPYWLVTIVSIHASEPDYRVRGLLVRKVDSLVADGADLLSVWTDGGYTDAAMDISAQGVRTHCTRRWKLQDTVFTDSVTVDWSVTAQGRWQRRLVDSIHVPGVPHGLFLEENEVQCIVGGFGAEVPADSLYRTGNEAVMADAFGIPGTVEGRDVFLYAISRDILAVQQRFSYGVFLGSDGSGGVVLASEVEPISSEWMTLPRKSGRSWTLLSREASGGGKPAMPESMKNDAIKALAASGGHDQWRLDLCTIELRVLLSGPSTSVFRFHYRVGD